MSTLRIDGLTLVSPGALVHSSQDLLGSSLLLQLSIGAVLPLSYPLKTSEICVSKLRTAGTCYMVLHAKCLALFLNVTAELCSTVRYSSSFSSWAAQGHQPLTLFCLKMEILGSSCSFVIISRVHNLAVLAPRGKRFKSSSIDPMQREELRSKEETCYFGQ